MSINLCLSGASGRMGRAITAVLGQYPQFTLVSALERESSSLLGHPVSIGREDAPDANISADCRAIKYSSDVDRGVAVADVVVDFSSATFTETLLAACVKHKKPILIATTGHNDRERAAIEEASREIPVLLASNTSLGVFVMNELATMATRYLGPAYDVELMEIHHRHKKDAPSGTALSLARNVSQVNEGEIVTVRSGNGQGRSENEIGVQSLRGGDVVGDHTIFFLGPSERIEITHRCTDRSVFARGALILAEKLIVFPNRLYNPADLFKL